MSRKQYDSKILRSKIVKDPLVLEVFAQKFGYRIGDLVKPISSQTLNQRKKYSWSAKRDHFAVRCCWTANRERPIRNGEGRLLDIDEPCIVLDVIESANGRLTIVLTREGKQGFVLSSDLERVQANPEEE